MSKFVSSLLNLPGSLPVLRSVTFHSCGDIWWWGHNAVADVGSHYKQGMHTQDVIGV